MENPQKEELNLRTFNTAKVYAEQILFPLMFDYKKFQRQANYGHDNMEKASELSEELREIGRFNGLKGMAETCQDLLNAIASSVRLKNNKKEIEQLLSLVKITGKIKLMFYENKERFFSSVFRDTKTIEILNRNYFEQIKDIIETCYINTEILMTKNKLLFADSNDEYLSDDEIKKQILDEYIDG